jgi:hypothetical protein
MKLLIFLSILVLAVTRVVSQTDPALAANDTTEDFVDLLGSSLENFNDVQTLEGDIGVGELQDGEVAGFGEEPEENSSEIAESGYYRRCRYFPCNNCPCITARCSGSGYDMTCRSEGKNCYCAGQQCWCAKGKTCFCKRVNCYCKKCTPPFYLGQFCKNCLWSNHIGYTHFPYDCSKFIVCIRNKLPPYEYETHLMYCPAGTYWNHDLLTCSQDIPPYDKCIFKPNTHEVPLIEGCKLEAGPYPNSFVQDGILRTCPAFTIFVPKQCACVLKYPVECGDLILDLPFDHDINDISCNKAIGELVHGSVTIDLFAHKGKASAYFHGDGFLFYALLSNYYTFKNIQQFTISLFVYSYDKGSNVQGLLTQADTTDFSCDTPFELHIGTGTLITGKINTDMGNAVVVGNFVQHAWTHVVLRYSAPKTDLFINGVIVDTSYNAKGRLINSKCPLIVGWKGKVKNVGVFEGWMDNIQIFSWAKSDYFIQNIW